ncbi:MAG: efflux RND transporter periplasmic adaptor subunit [Verrucomicrobiota bacterium]|nr:efflux RND transporter periplasmic adaptor subunit [Verrucomicrobiota bacterium]
MNLLRSKRLLATLLAAVVLLIGLIWFLCLPIAEVAQAHRGTAIAAVYGTVRIEPTFVIHVRAQNSGFIQLADPFLNGRAAIGRPVQKGELFATIADEATARQLKQAQADLQAARQRAELPLPSSEPLKVAEDSVQRLERLSSLSNVPAVEYQRAKSDVTRLTGQLEAERIERDRNIESLETAATKLEAQMKNSEIRSPMDGLLTAMKAIDGELVAEGNELFTVSSQQNYVRGEVNEEDIGEVKIGMPALLQVYAFRARQFRARVTAIVPTADPETQRYTVVLEMENAPDNLLGGMTGEMNIITGQHENALLMPTRALLGDDVLVVFRGFVRRRKVQIGLRTLENAEVVSGLREGESVIVADQDKFRAGQPVHSRLVTQ